MKILFCHLYDPSFGMGGADRGVLDLVSEVAARNHEVKAAVNSGPLAEAFGQRKISWQEIPHSKTHTLQLLKVISETAESFKPDLIHSHHRYTTFLLSNFLKKKFPILHTERIQVWDKRFFYRYGHMATAVSEDLRRHLISHYRVPPEKVKTIVNAVQIRRADENAVQRLRTEFKKGESFIALSPGRLGEQKGHGFLIDAVRLLPENQRKKLIILLAGDGPLEKELRLQADRCGVSAQFRFLGYRADIPELFCISDFAILASLWEGLPRVVLEAFACGKSVVATRIPGTAEAVQDRENGLLVPPGNPEALKNALAEMMGDTELRVRLTQGAKTAGSRFSFSKMVDQYLDLYQTMIRNFKEGSL